MSNAALTNLGPTSSLAQLLKAAGDDLRLAILQALTTDSYGVLELAKVFGVRQSGMSHHLKVLANAGLVVTRREGNSIFYRRASLAPNDALATIKQVLFQQLDAAPLPAQYQQQLANIWRARGQASQQFFLENANKFKAQQDLIGSIDVYRTPVIELMDLTTTPTTQAALEVGPGEGELLGALSKRFSRIVALDNSCHMLTKAKAKAQQEKLNNVDFVHGDTSLLEDYRAHFDFAVINMVLHHTPSPAKVFADVSHCLKSRGALLVTELCLHDQAWAQEACGDIWLGFDPEDLTSWAASAHFDEGQSVYFALRNGFQIQIRQFFKQ